MKKVVSILFVAMFFVSCTKETSDDTDKYNQEKLNQIEAVDGKKIKRPGSGGGN